jgi:hypothetical protein
MIDFNLNFPVTTIHSGWREVVSIYSVPLYFTMKKHLVDPYKLCGQGFAKIIIELHYSQFDKLRCIATPIWELGSLVIDQFRSLDYNITSSKTELLTDILRINYVYKLYRNPIILLYFSKHKKLKGLTAATRKARININEQNLIAGENFKGMLSLMDTLSNSDFTEMITRIHDESQAWMLNSGLLPPLKVIRLF